MRVLTSAIVAALCLGLLGTNAEAQGKNNKKGHAIQGIIVKVHADKNPKDKDLGTITVKTKGNKGHAVKIQVMKDTKIDNVAGPKGGKSAASFGALHAGERVLVHTRAGHHADRIEILAKEKKQAS